MLLIINSIDSDNLKNIGQEYINNLKSISNDSERVSDKLPINFKWIGLIKLILPNSKIVHCVRNPRDNCISIFKNYFLVYLEIPFHVQQGFVFLSIRCCEIV